MVCLSLWPIQSGDMCTKTVRYFEVLDHQNHGGRSGFINLPLTWWESLLLQLCEGIPRDEARQRKETTKPRPELLVASLYHPRIYSEVVASEIFHTIVEPAQIGVSSVFSDR